MKELSPNTNKRKIIRTLRCKTKNIIGTFANLITTISQCNGDLGAIKTVTLGEQSNVRDITVVANDHEHLQEIIAKVKKLANVELKQVIDEVLELHHGGKIRTQATYPIESYDDLRKVYTPGVAQVCAMIQASPQEAMNYTSIQKNVALITNGSRVLGLGNIGPLASMPVMEGKAALFSQFTGLNMFPILLNTRDPKKFIETVLEISSGFGAIQLEDIETPGNFEIEAELISKLDKPVMHDDQHGTAVVSMAAAIRACELTKRDLKKQTIGLLGLGAAGFAIGCLLKAYTGQEIFGFDVNKEAVNRFCAKGGSSMSDKDIMQKCDLVIMTTGKRGVVKKDMVRKGQIILALSNPYPEISIEDALEAGAAYASDGTRVNNLLGYPGIFKGSLEVNAKKITTDMLIAAAKTIARLAPETELVPNVLNRDLHDAVAHAVSDAAIKSGVARIIPDQPHFLQFEKLEG